MKVFIVTGRSESSDDYGPLAFSQNPSDKLLSQIAHDWDGDENHDGPGSYGSYVYLETQCVEIDEELDAYS